MFDKFELTIRGGNEAMQTPEDVAWALQTVVNRIEAGEMTGTEEKIRDYNGNVIGSFKFKGVE